MKNSLATADLSGRVGLSKSTWLILSLLSGVVLAIIAQTFLVENALMRMLLRLLTGVFAFFVFRDVIAAVRLHRRQRSENGDGVLARDRRPPIVYLRSFQEDGTGICGLPIVLPQLGLALPTPRITFEEALAPWFRSIGPFVALSVPGERVGELGAARLAVSNDQWQGTVEQLLKVCRLVVFRAGYTDGLWWEFRKMFELVSPDKIVLYFQFGNEHDRGVRQARYRRFVREAAEVLPCPLPDAIGHAHFVYFDGDGNAHCTRDVQSVLKAKGFIFDNPGRSALKRLLPLAAARKATPKPREQQSFRSEFERRTLWGGLVLVAILISVIAGLLSGLTAWVNPLPLLGVIPVMAYSYIAGAGSGMAGRFLKLPGSHSYAALGLLGSIIFTYSSWTAWTSACTRSLCATPAEVVQAVANFRSVLWKVAEGPEASAYFGFISVAEWLIIMVTVSFTTWVYGPSTSEIGHGPAGTEPTDRDSKSAPSTANRLWRRVREATAYGE